MSRRHCGLRGTRLSCQRFSCRVKKSSDKERAEPLSRTVRLILLTWRCRPGQRCGAKYLVPTLTNFAHFLVTRFIQCGSEREVLSKITATKSRARCLSPIAWPTLYAPTISWDHKFVAKPPVQKYLDNFKALSLEVQITTNELQICKGHQVGHIQKRRAHREAKAEQRSETSMCMMKNEER